MDTTAPRVLNDEQFVFHPLIPRSMFQLFEGMKAYRGIDDKIRLFRPDLNMERMRLSAQRSGLPMFDGDELIKCIRRLVQIDQEWVPHSESSTVYIRPTLIGTEVRPLAYLFSIHLVYRIAKGLLPNKSRINNT